MIEHESVTRMVQDRQLLDNAKSFFNALCQYKYSYHFDFMGRPIIQFPQDMVAMQELIWQIRPDLIIETGIAHGGSLVMNAAMLAMLDICDAIAVGENLTRRFPGARSWASISTFGRIIELLSRRIRCIHVFR